jgi:tetratricopeptide (TPR) repeat protein
VILQLAEQAARARRDAAAPELAWANAIEAVGDPAGALRRFEQACARFPDDEALHSGHAAALARAGRTDDALERAEQWIPSPWALKLQFRMLLRLGRTDRLEALEEALSRADPADPDLLEYRARRWRESPDLLLMACERALASNPCAMHAVYHQVVALAQLGHSDAAAALMGLDRLIQIAALPIPPPYTSADTFYADLEKEIVENGTLHADPAGHATRQGLRTATYPLPGDRAGTALIQAIRERIGAYAASLSGDHPFVTARPAEATLKSWALLFRSSGHQALHHHPGPWMTGVYYVKAPPGPKGSGALRIGNLPASAGVRPPWPIIDLQPTQGTLVLFPSFVPHETLPTGSEELRISIAFDVTPVGG